LQAVCDAGFEVVLAVTQPDRPAGRGGRMQAPPVKLAASGLGIEVFQPATFRDGAGQETLRNANADVFVVAAYGKILPTAVLAIPEHGCLNVHASLLPKWRGPSPIVASILHGDVVSGVSIIRLERKMDAGPVISQVEQVISAGETAGELESELAEIGANELVRVLPSWLSGSLTATPQDEALATYCALITKEDGFLKAEMTSEEAERAVRAYNPWPGAFVMYREQRLAIWKARIAAGPDARPGSVIAIERWPAIAFAGGWLALEEVQKPGGKRLSGQQFMAGERGQLAETVGLR
jgi:methionyl-tRNA formyltransferase